MSSGYLNKKSWHPGSKRNMERVWALENEAKQRRVEEVERANRVKEERDWERERDLTADEAAKRRGGVAWMYQSSVPADTRGTEGDAKHQPRRRESRKQPTDDPALAEARLAKMLAGIRSTSTIPQSGDQGATGSYGLVDCDLESDEEEAAFRLSQMPADKRGKELKRMKKEERRRRKKEEKRSKEEKRRKKVEAARALLKQAQVHSDHVFLTG